LIKIEITPVDLVTETGPSRPARIKYTAMGSFSDGRVDDITTKVSWLLGSADLGAFGADSVHGRLEGSVTRGGKTTVTAMTPGVGGRMAQTGLTLVYAAALTKDAAPGNAPELFKTAAEEATKAPTITAPGDGVTVPRRTPGTFSWTAPAGTNLFELAFQNEVTDMHLYTTNRSITLSPEEWSILGTTNSGGQVNVLLRAMTSASPTSAGTSRAIKLTFSP
jgi:hypothetical protein